MLEPYFSSRNFLVNLVGANTEEVKPHTFSTQVNTGDIVVMFTDGITKILPLERIMEKLKKMEYGKSPEEIIKQLMPSDPKRPNADDSTVIAFQIT